jgi:hypothetical protein
MKTFFHSLKFAALTLSIFFTTSASAGLKSNATCINYNGEDILQFELEEVETQLQGQIQLQISAKLFI